MRNDQDLHQENDGNQLPAAPGPRYAHDCTDDVYLGQFGELDLYVADHGGSAQYGGGTYIARNSNEPSQYIAGAIFVGKDPAITEAHRLATTRGIALPGIPQEDHMTTNDETALNAAIDNSGMDFTPVDLTTLVGGQRTWAEKFAARGYVLVHDENGGGSWVHPQTQAFLTGQPQDDGINVCLWDDFFNPFTRQAFDTDDAYLDAVEDRFKTLWANWDNQ